MCDRAGSESEGESGDDVRALGIGFVTLQHIIQLSVAYSAESLGWTTNDQQLFGKQLARDGNFYHSTFQYTLDLNLIFELNDKRARLSHRQPVLQYKNDVRRIGCLT